MRPLMRMLLTKINGGGSGLTYLLRDDFTTADAAPLTSPRTAEPGPGTGTITDSESKLSISSGKLVLAGKASPGFSDPFVAYDSLERATGRTLVFIHTPTGNHNLYIGWSSSSTPGLANHIAAAFTDSSGILARINGGNSGSIFPTYTTTAYKVAVVLRGTGTFILGKGDTLSEWTLLWVDNTMTTTPLYPVITNYNSTGTLNSFRVLDLAAPFDTDYGLVTQRLAGARNEGDTFTHEANLVLEYVQTTLASTSTSVRFAVQDVNNCWFVNINSTGAITLFERVAGVNTSRGSAAGVVSNGHRIVVVRDGTTIRVYSNNALRITYSSASNFQSMTAGNVFALGTGGAVSDIVSWPRTLGAAPAALLDAGVA